MDVSALSAVTSAAEAARAQEAASVSLLRKSLDAQGAVALQLIEALSVPGLGENIDVRG
jgi:phage portal protein BeeE